MQLDQLPKIIHRSKKRLGRGLGSGKGKTGGRGQKGQKARGKVKVGFTGGGGALYKRLPLLRGWGNKPVSVKPVPINLSKVAQLDVKGPINLEVLIQNKLVPATQAKKFGVKILGNSEISKKMVISGILVSAGAKQSIEAAGGQVD